jgi:hypothetical protein
MEPAYINVSNMFISSTFGLPGSSFFGKDLPAYSSLDAEPLDVGQMSLSQEAMVAPPPGLEGIVPLPPPGLAQPQVFKGSETRPTRTSSSFSSMKSIASQLSMASTTATDNDSVSECGKSDDAGTTIGDTSEAVEKKSGSGEVGGLEIGKDDVRMLMIMNIPGRCTEEELMDVVRSKGFDKDCMFFHMPFFTSKKRVHHKGYAFIGFPDMHITAHFASEMSGYRFQRGQSLKTCKVVPARIQDMSTVVQDLSLKGSKGRNSHCAKRFQTENFQ